MRTTLKQSKNYFYAKTEGNYGYRMLHRFIMNAPDEYVVDHINNDTTDNRKSNLRICTFQANCRNRRLSSNNTSGYTGVTWIKKSSKWMAYIHVKDKYKNLGYFNDIQNLMIAADAGLTDYSSWIFDYILLKRPTFIIANDLETFETNRSFYYPLDSTPFPIASTNEQLLQNINDFDNDVYLKDINRFLDERGCFEDGHASERIADMIVSLCKKGI